MFYEKQSVEQKNNYKNMLSIVGSLSNMFSASNEPMLYYRAHENIFCKYFEAINLSREDCSADAMKGVVGIGLKTWVGRDDQKVAEFGRLRPQYEHLSGIELIRAIAEYRNARIKTTMNAHGLTEMIYHIVKRVPRAMKIYEIAFDPIDIDNIVIDETRGNANNTYFSDGNHTYHFSTSKNTLYMIFDDMELMDSFDVNILDDPYEVLKNLLPQRMDFNIETDAEMELTVHSIVVDGKTVKTKEFYPKKNQMCLRLYSTKPDGTKFVAEKSGLNQWNGVRTSNRTRKDGTVVHTETQRDENELYIPYPAEDRRRTEGFFPPRDTDFDLLLPDGEWIKAKVCQADGKAIMSNPNNKLGQWLLRTVFELPVGKQVTYDMLRVFNVDCVVFTKLEDVKYSINFGTLGTYERFYGLDDIEAVNDIDEDEE